MTAEAILNARQPGDLYSPDSAKMEEEYKSLAKKFHPDVFKHPKASDVMATINDLYDKGIAMLREDRWEASNVVRFPAKKGTSTHEIHFYTSRPFELGMMYVSDSIVCYVVEGVYRDLFSNAGKTIDSFKYGSDRMKAECERYLPKVRAKFETADNRLGMVIDKTPDLLLLKDVLAYFEGKIPDRHAAWILSSLYNLACYFDFAGLTHNAVSLDNYFISPQYHSGAMLGGWWYSVPKNNKMIGVPKDIFSIMPPSVKNKKLGSIQTDLESIRLVGRSILGDSRGTKLLDMKVAPEPFVKWLKGVSAAKAVDEYSNWAKVLEASYGKRRFVEMSLSREQLYRKIKGGV